QHSDVWQLCFITKRNLDRVGSPVRDEHKGLWPIDFADAAHLRELLNAWESTETKSLAETGDLHDFYRSVEVLRSRCDFRGLDSNLRGAVRYLSIPEVAT